MELLNHFVAARLMKDAQLFERIGLHGASGPRQERRSLQAVPDNPRPADDGDRTRDRYHDGNVAPADAGTGALWTPPG